MATRPTTTLRLEQPPHWTRVVYRDHAELFYDVEAALFQNARLTRLELDRVAELAQRIGAPLKSPLVDLACGPGRHTLELARRGFEVTGVDLSEPFLTRARAGGARLAGTAPAARFVCSDLRQLGLAAASFDSVLLLGNSFGYFSDDDNRAILDEMRRILRPGGLLCMEITHREAYLAALVPYEEETIRGHRHDGLRCQWWKSWNPGSRRIVTMERHSRVDTGEVVYEGPYEVRLYGWRELRRHLLASGFGSPRRMSFSPSIETLAGGLGETFGAMSEVLFVAARG